MEAVAGLLCSGDSVLVPGKDVGSRSRAGVDSGTNTEPDWEDQIRAELESGSKVSQDFNALKLKQQQDELDFNKSKSELQRKSAEAVRQHKALLEKLESVRVKLQLNNSKAMRKNFMSKIQEVTSERNRAQEERDRLSLELAEAQQQLSSLEQEQKEEQHKWDQELSELRSQTERAQNEAREAVCSAQRDERAAVERQRDAANESIETWLNQVNVYLSGLQAELPLRHRQEKTPWENREAEVKQKQAELRSRFTELLQRLDQGQELQSLPQISLPSLKQVPMAELYFHRIMQMTNRPSAPPLSLWPRPLT
ncbi:hypothetical protein WMY93_004263 [Mugilogobius chulae]|uniref:Uncharacterized protein n=1 Tax=Mugilogobius chulae TaxID=88201 RepID=A0AAW0PN93_9GOBI